MLFGFFRPLRMRTPWFASKYGAENDTTFARSAVIVTSSNAKSNFFAAGEKSPLNGARRYWTLLIPSFFAIAWDSAHSKPDGFLIVVPVGLPFQNAGAGTSKPTISFPGFFVGTAVDVAPAVAVTARAVTQAATRNRFTVPPWLFPGSRDECSALGPRECEATAGSGTSDRRRPCRAPSSRRR